MRLILMALLCVAGSYVAHAQIDTSYHLLWYSGKKLRPNVLLTPGKDTVTYTPSRGTVKMASKAGKGKQLDNMLTELNKTSKRAQELIVRLSSKLPKAVLPSVSSNIRAAYNDVDDAYRKVLSSSVSLPAMPLPLKTAPIGKGGYTDEETGNDIWDDAVKKMEDYRINHANDNLYNIPEPPRSNLTYCYTCNAEAKNIYNKQVEKFIAAITGEDDKEMMIFAFGASRQAEFLLGENRRQYVQGEIVKLLDFIIQRLRKKVSLLIERYISEPEQAIAVLQVALTLDRQMQLMGIGEPIAENYMGRAFEAYVKRIKKAMAEEDYSIALNFELLISTDRQMQLSMSGYYEDILNQALKFNQFKVNMNITARTGSDDGFLLAQLRGDNWFMAFPDTACHLKWFLVGPYMNKLKMDLESADMRGNGGQVPYVGTKNWEAPASTIRIDFCNDKPDTVIAYPFNAEEFVELWQFPAPTGTINMQQINGLFLSCFMDPERVKEEAAELKNPDKVEKMKKEMAAQYQQYLKLYQSGKLNGKAKNIDMPTLNAMARSQELARGISEMVYSVNPGRFIFTPTVHNKERIVVQDRLDGKILFPDNAAIEYAYFHLKIEHDPEGPYVISL
jgi:hypothetical protein